MYSKKNVIFIIFTAVFLSFLCAALLFTDAYGSEHDTSGSESISAISVEPTSEASNYSTEPSSEASDYSPEPSSDEPEESHPEQSESTSEEVSQEVSQEESFLPPVEIKLPYDPDGLLLLPREIEPSEYDEYFQNSLFIGNSLVVNFSYYVSSRRLKTPDFLGKADFFAAHGFSAFIDLYGNESQFPRLRGKSLHSWEAAGQAGADTVYFCLMGLTEIWRYAFYESPERTFENNRAVMQKIIDENPGVRIVVISAPYMARDFNSSARALNNNLISRFNALALDWCNQNGIDFVDVSTPFLEGNSVPDKYLVDATPDGQGCHLKSEYYSAWVGVLRNYAYLKQNGAWQNPASMAILQTE